MYCIYLCTCIHIRPSDCLMKFSHLKICILSHHTVLLTHHGGSIQWPTFSLSPICAGNWLCMANTLHFATPTPPNWSFWVLSLDDLICVLWLGHCLYIQFEGLQFYTKGHRVALPEQGPLLPPLSWASIGLSPQGRTASAATKAPWSSFPSRHILFTNLLMWLGLVMLLWPRSCSCLRTWQGTMLPCCLDYIKSTVKSKTNPWNRWILSGQGS